MRTNDFSQSVISVLVSTKCAIDDCIGMIKHLKELDIPVTELQLKEIMAIQDRIILFAYDLESIIDVAPKNQ